MSGVPSGGPKRTLPWMALLAAASLAVSGCATRPDQAAALDLPLVRAAIISSVGEDGRPLDDPPVVRQVGARNDVLLLSGGGSDGAFGAGVLVGWTAAGTRPNFDVVTGVSTGALMATLAFLGPSRDADLVRAYTQITTKDVYRKRGVFGLIGKGALFDRAPLEAMIAGLVTEAMLDEVAREHKKGRRLFVGTTDLDTGVMTTWDMGRIASSASPDRAILYRQVLAASSALPGLFAPVYIRQSEALPTMHVDGGVKAAILFRSYMVDPTGQNENVWAIVNGHVSFKGNEAPGGANAGSIVGRSVSELLRTITQRSVQRTYTMTRNAGAKFNLAYLPDDVEETDPLLFVPLDMKRLFDKGVSLGSSGGWSPVPPRLEPLERMR